MSPQSSYAFRKLKKKDSEWEGDLGRLPKYG